MAELKPTKSKGPALLFIVGLLGFGTIGGLLVDRLRSKGDPSAVTEEGSGAPVELSETSRPDPERLKDLVRPVAPSLGEPAAEEGAPPVDEPLPTPTLPKHAKGYYPAAELDPSPRLPSLNLPSSPPPSPPLPGTAAAADPIGINGNRGPSPEPVAPAPEQVAPSPEQAPPSPEQPAVE